MQQSDHDLLVTLVAKVDAFIAGQAAAQNDHESRIRVLESGANTTQGTTTATKWVVGVAFLAVGILEPLLLWVVGKQ